MYLSVGTVRRGARQGPVGSVLIVSSQMRLRNFTSLLSNVRNGTYVVLESTNAPGHIIGEDEDH
jgi:hypothetical protein